MLNDQYIINEEAYTFELIENSNSLFNNDVVNATYIIYLAGNNDRYDNILKQINDYKTTNKIYILHNKGYKKSKKSAFIDKPPLDLVDAYLTIFKHSFNNGFSNILIFEDDFICDDKLSDTNVTNDITSFMMSRENEMFVYYLGVLPLILSQEKNKHRKCIFTIGTHAVIYSSKFIKTALTIQQETIDDWDAFISKIIISEDKNGENNNVNCQKYTYIDCLCYQPFPETDNSKYWGSNMDIIGSICFQTFHKFLGFINLDTNPILGFKLFYSLCIKTPYTE